jgi:hypothetical protein
VSIFDCSQSKAKNILYKISTDKSAKIKLKYLPNNNIFRGLLIFRNDEIVATTK